MKKGLLYKILSCTCLLVFMYLAASCSISNDKKEDNGIKKSYDNVEEAKKISFADEAMAFVRSAQEAYVTSAVEGVDKTCFTVSELIDGFVSTNSPDKYYGIVEKISDNEWKIYVSNGKYSIDGKKFPLSKNDVNKSKDISKTKC